MVTTVPVPGGLYSRHGTVNLARIGQRLAHVGPLERLRSIQRLGKLSLAQKKNIKQQRDFFENRDFLNKTSSNFKTKTYRDIKYVQNIAK